MRAAVMPLGAAPSSPAREPRPDSQVDLVRPVVQRPDRRNPARQAKQRGEKLAAPQAVPSSDVAAPVALAAPEARVAPQPHVAQDAVPPGTERAAVPRSWRPVRRHHRG